MKQLLTERVEQKYSEGKLVTIYRLGGEGVSRAFTPEEQIKEVRAGTSIGNDILMAEAKLIEELKRRI